MESTSEIEIGVIGRPHGVRGDVLVWFHNPSSELPSSLATVTLLGPNGQRRELPVRRIKPVKKGAHLLVSDELNDRDLADAIKGWRVVVDKAILPPLQEDDEFYYHELCGLPLMTPAGRTVGTVRHVIETSVDVLVVDRLGGGELMVPIVSDFVVEFDRAAGLVRVVEDLETYFEDVL